MLSGKLSNGWKKFVHFLQETNWQYTSEEWIGSRWIGSELADNFSITNILPSERLTAFEKPFWSILEVFIYVFYSSSTVSQPWFYYFSLKSNWQTTSAGGIGRRRIGSELADNFSLGNRTVQKPLSIPIISPLHQRKCHVPSSSIPKTLIQALSLSKCTMFVSSFLVKKMFEMGVKDSEMN